MVIGLARVYRDPSRGGLRQFVRFPFDEDWLIVDELWVEDSYRHTGLGRALLTEAHEWGVSVGCRFARLNTFEFEARNFYEAHGYVVENQSNDFPTGHIQFHLTKRLV